MSRKKGVSKDDKLKIVQNIMMESNDIWSIAELEKACSKKGIRSMIVKDLIQELLDDDLISSDKIGKANFYWCFPSEAYNRRRVAEEKITNEIASYENEIVQLEAEIQQLQPGREETPEREQLDKEIDEFKQQIKEIQDEASKYDKLNPELIQRRQRQAVVAFESANRWTDNIFTIQSWVTTKFGKSKKEFLTSFRLGEDFDYFE